MFSSRLSCVPRLDLGDGAHLRHKLPNHQIAPHLPRHALEFVETNPSPSKSEILERPRGRDINAEDAIREMEALQ